MAKWVTKELEKLLKQINNVPEGTSREGIQLSLLMKGFADLNNQAMDNAATKTREQLRNWSLDDQPDDEPSKKGNIEQVAAPEKTIEHRKGSIEEKMVQSKDRAKKAASDALTKLRPIR